MKYFILLYLAVFFLIPMQAKSQTTNNYKPQWEKVVAAEKKGLSRTARKLTKKIYAKAAKEGNEQQQIKALIYQLKYRDAIEEHALLKNMLEVDSLSATAASKISKALLQNLEANLYLAYVQKNRYRLRHRSVSSAEKEEEPATWSLPHFYFYIDSLFQQSLLHKDALQKLEVKNYLVLIDSGKNSLALRPTIYDILAHDALKFYTGQASFLELPAHHFVINNPNALNTAKKFGTLPLSSSDSLSPVLKALKIYQKLILFHLKDDSADALIDIDLERIQYVYRQTVMPDKDSLYRQALRHVISRYAIPAKYKATALLAQWYYLKGRKYAVQDNPNHRWALKKALALCKKVPDTIVNEGTLQCQKIKDRILRPEIGVSVEKVNLPGKPFRVLVSYKNRKQLWFKIVKLDDDPETIFHQKLTPEQLSEKDITASWQQEFPLPKDYQKHAAEMKVSALPLGRYALIATADSNFQKNKPLIYTTFQVSNLSYITNNDNGILVLDRESGKPVKKAKVRLWKRVYSRTDREYEIEHIGKYKTNADGYVKINKKEGAYIMLEITSEDDHIFIPKGAYFPYIHRTSSKVDQPEITSRLFTDRSIYRPGQKLYFKGILFQLRPNDKNTVIANKKVKVFLYDANYQIIDSVALTSNAFGSFADNFTLPSVLRNGRMHIAVDSISGSEFFRVEEYKRPTFDMAWDSVALTYQLGDTVALSGTIMGYNNVPIGDAKVKYQVTRKRYIIPYYIGYHYSRSLILYPVREAVVSQGSIHSQSTGHFTISFPAIPDETVPEGKRIFNYEVAVDVTDINGESHHYSYSLPIGDQSILLHLSMKDKISSQALDSLYLTSTDLSGRFISTPVALSVYALKEPGRFIRKRYWGKPDQYLMDKSRFISFFPHDEYKNEADIKSWEINHAVFVDTDTTQKNGQIAFHYQNLPAGWYLIKATAKDKYDHFVTDSQYIQVYKTNDNQLPFHQVLWTNTNEMNSAPGQKISWQIGSSEKTFVFEQSERSDHASEVNNFRLNSRIKEKQFDVGSADRGGMIMHYVTVLYNRVFTEDIKINVPWKNKHLHITYETFRNKIRPGEKETWTVKITGQDQQKVNAELLASMYDISLDYFTPHSWKGFNDLYPSNNGTIRWEGNAAFSDISGKRISQIEADNYPEYSVIYPSLKKFGYDWNRRPIRLAGAPLSDMVVVGYSTQQNKRKMTGSAEKKAEAAPAPKEAPEKTPINIRTNFRETAFFYPQLHTDDSGTVSFTFTAPEALTRWKLMLFAHTKDLKFAYAQKETVTQKPLMIQLNAPRFVRQGDQLVLSAKVSNLSKKIQSGHATLNFKNTVTAQTISIVNAENKQPFTVKPGQSIALTWSVKVPKKFTDALTYTVKAISDNYSDGAQDILPVLTNKARITESLPLHFSGNGTHKIQWNAPAKINDSHAAIQPESMTIEYTGNPIWYAVQALPFLSKETRESANALFRKVYANALSRYVALKIPHFKDIMQQWLTADTNALKSPLQKNQELKNVLLKETPWVRIAQTEAAQKSEVAHWYEEDDFQLRLKAATVALQNMQMSNGGFSWFKDMPDSRYITQEIITGLGHLKTLHAWPHIAFHNLKQIVDKAIPYLDARMKENYDNLKKQDLLDSPVSPINIQYLYMRSFFPDIAIEKDSKKAYDYFYQKTGKEWVQQNTLTKAMLVLTFHRKGKDSIAHTILRSLKEAIIADKNGGMHWKQPNYSYFWYHAPITTQALSIEAFSTLQADQDTLNALRTWLLNQKQTHFWGTGKATANAVYALLLSGTEWISSHPQINIQLGDTTLLFGNDKNGLQYKKVVIPGNAVTAEMRNMQVTISGAAADQPSWGAAYFQYFANMNQVDKGKGSGLHIERQISLETNTSLGKKLMPISPSTTLEVGDKVQVRLIVKADRDMDFVHLKDVRASCMEPLQVLSGYNWNNGLGYYSSVSDAAVHFYFPHVTKGTYVFTYPVYITQKGNFTGGLSQIECLYAPEIRAHSEGVSLQIK